MNVITFISNLNNTSNLFEKTFGLPIESYHLDNSRWEASTTFYVMHKSQIETKEEALMLSIIQSFVRHGDYHWGDTPKEEIFQKVIEHLEFHYSNASFQLTNKCSLSECIERFRNETLTRIYRNHHWNQQMEKDALFAQDWVKEKAVNTYHLLSEWNDEDYLFETENYFIRYNWGTSA